MDQETESKTDAFADGVVTVEQAMALTALSRSTIYLIGEGRVMTSKVRRRRLLSRSDLLAVLRAGATSRSITASAASPAQSPSTTVGNVDKEPR
jgi:hypothetical protein